jgi:hypothetical protein
MRCIFASGGGSRGRDCLPGSRRRRHHECFDRGDDFLKRRRASLESTLTQERSPLRRFPSVLGEGGRKSDWCLRRHARSPPRERGCDRAGQLLERKVEASRIASAVISSTRNTRPSGSTGVESIDRNTSTSRCGSFGPKPSRSRSFVARCRTSIKASSSIAPLSTQSPDRSDTLSR